MKKKALLIFILLLIPAIPTATAKLVEVDVPLTLWWEYDVNESEFEFEIREQGESITYWSRTIEENESDETNFNLKYDAESSDICPEYESEAQAYNWTSSFNNMTQALDKMINVFNQTNNLSQEVILTSDLREEIGRCSATAEEHYNQSKTLKEENTVLRDELNTYKRYRSDYNSCISDLEESEDKVTSRGFIGGLIGLGIYHFLFKKKRARPEEAEQEEWGDYGHG